MKRVLLIVALSALATLTAGVATYYYFDNKTIARAQQTACVATVVPMVSLHHNQQEIVSLMEDLAREDDAVEDRFLKENSTPTSKYIFSKGIDEKLVEIANMYRSQEEGGAIDHNLLDKHLTSTVESFEKEAPEYMKRCRKLLVDMEQECGSLDGVDPNQTECRSKYNEKLQSIIKETSKI